MKISLRRIAAAIVDALLLYAMFFLCSVLYSELYVKNDAVYQKNADRITEILLESHLYEKRDGSIKEIDDGFDESLTYFYQTYPYVDGPDSYEDVKKRSGLFIVSADGNYIEREDIEEERFRNFYAKEMEKAVTSLYNFSEYRTLEQYNRKVIDVGAYLSLTVASLIVYLVLPLIIKRGRTIGKWIFRLEVVSADGKKASVPQMMIRAWSFTFLILLSFWFYFIALCVDAIIYLFDRKHRSIQDFCAVTEVREIREVSHEEKGR